MATLLGFVNSLRRHLPACTWTAVLAVLLLALLPTVSHALGHARGAGLAWAEVCTPQGMRLVAMPAETALATPASPVSPAPAPLLAAGHLEHCALCTLSPDTPALPAPAPPLVWPAPGSSGWTAEPVAAVVASRGWPGAQARAPPVSG